MKAIRNLNTKQLEYCEKIINKELNNNKECKATIMKEYIITSMQINWLIRVIKNRVKKNDL